MTEPQPRPSEWYPSFNPDPCSGCGRLVIVSDEGLCKRCHNVAEVSQS